MDALTPSQLVIANTGDHTPSYSTKGQHLNEEVGFISPGAMIIRSVRKEGLNFTEYIQPENQSPPLRFYHLYEACDDEYINLAYDLIFVSTWVDFPTIMFRYLGRYSYKG